MDLRRIFNQASKTMQLDLEAARTAFKHPSSLGDASEASLHKFLKKYLPGRFGVCKGFGFDIDGNLSNQLDVIIYDRLNTPVFYKSKDKKIRNIPIECIYAVIETKTILSKNELDKSFSNMKSVKRLRKKAFFTKKDGYPHEEIRTHYIYGRKYHYWPTHYYLFAFESKINPDPCVNYINDIIKNESLPLYQRIDQICILNKGIITYCRGDRILELPEPRSFLKYLHTEDSLLMFYTCISNILNQAMLRPFKISEYTDNLKIIPFN